MNDNSKWKPAQGNILTRWAGEIDPCNVLPEYPRPQMKRNNWMNLNGLWDYVIKPDKEDIPSDFEGKILVPYPLESSLSGVKKSLLPKEKLWYRRSFTVCDKWKKDRLLLHFGAVDWKAEVWINNLKVGEHTGGYYPFTFEITEFIKEGENEVVVSVWDPTDTYGQERGKQVLKPKGMFYTPVSGIWQTVWIEPVPKNYIKSIKLIPDIDNEELSVEVEVDAADGEIHIEASAYEGNKEIIIDRHSMGETLKLKISSPKLWSPDSPFLYDLKIRLIKDAAVIDEITSYFGMRKFSIGEDNIGIKRLLLNNLPLFQNGVLDQGYWPDGLYTTPTDDALKYDVETAKRLGFNMIRKHIKVEPLRWYYHCDKLGIIVWQDMINGGGSIEKLRHLLIPNLARGVSFEDTSHKKYGRHKQSNRDNYKKELKEMIDGLYNTVSIGLWVPFNEAWGQFDASEISKWVKEYDPTRLVDHASGWYDQGSGDIKSVHIYFCKLYMPKKLKNRAAAITEYGGYSLLEKGHVWREDKEYGYKHFETREELKNAYTSLINSQLRPLVPRGVSAAVFTQLTDVETEINGIITYDREVVKIDPEIMKELNTIKL
ncbi:glycoside hydrolase family 2 [Clostridium sp. YIM B02515]|uniref:Glycoside hydrolase family 2 n=1 Tax=Clostridium rhizosphaerae TaxID=2803861 RepID=A0ABS1TC16_9CLOT|nr:sugar-binding domain-containing protein [Clostridium rhizosphaerae]MBL4935528.1 glycoside hydrolase family 2 [Clostridium rhizosphaerae]